MDKDLTKKLKKAMNDAGMTPPFEGNENFGPRTEAALSDFDFTVSAVMRTKPKPQPEKPINSSDYFGAPWAGANNDLLGRDETDAELNARFVPHWKRVGLPGFKTLAGNTHAHCSLVEDANFYAVGIKGSGSAGAASWSKWGVKSPFWFGSVMDIKHKSGGRHVCTFLYWIDENKKIAATKDSNRSNKYGIFETDLSGRGDKLVTGPRWPKDYPDGQFVPMAEVLKKYPELKVGSKGTSGTTR